MGDVSEALLDEDSFIVEVGKRTSRQPLHTVLHGRSCLFNLGVALEAAGSEGSKSRGPGFDRCFRFGERPDLEVKVVRDVTGDGVGTRRPDQYLHRAGLDATVGGKKLLRREPSTTETARPC